MNWDQLKLTAGSGESKDEDDWDRRPRPNRLPDSRDTMPETACKSWTAAQVRCFAGYRADERPTAFQVGRREIEVVKILASWREPDHVYFKVETPDGSLYELRHHEYEDRWQVRQATGRRRFPCDPGI